MKMMIFRQFKNDNYDEFNYLFVLRDEEKSRTKVNDNLFGWGPDGFLKQYTNSFKLELKYD